MADDKKSFLLYSDLIHTVKHLSNEDAGKVFKWTLDYVNDKEPKPLKGLLAAVCEPIKQQLKRDLKKWEVRAERSRSNGSKGGRPKNPQKPTETQQVILEPKEPDSVNVSVSVNVNETKEKKFLSLFNTLKTKNTNRQSRVKILSTQDSANLKKLKGYTLKDFKIVINTMLEAEWPKATGNQTPSHILRVDNFNRYLEQGAVTKKETDQERAERLTEETKSQ